MDKLDKLLKTQSNLNTFIRKERKLNFSKEEWILRWCRSLQHEIIELEDEFNWKHWKNEKEIDWNNVKEESIDILHFLLSIFDDLGMSGDEVYNEYIKKNEENIKRQLGTSRRKGYELKKY